MAAPALPTLPFFTDLTAPAPAGQGVAGGTAAHDAVIAYIATLPGGAAESTETIASGVIVPDGTLCTIDTEGGAGTDDLTAIDASEMPPGSWLLLRSTAAARDITIKNASGAAGQILTQDGFDFLLDDPSQWIALAQIAGNWIEIWRSWGNKKTAQRSNLGLAIGTDVQAFSAKLAVLDALTWADKKGLRFTGAGAVSTFDLTDFALTLLDDADAATARATLGLDFINVSAHKNGTDQTGIASATATKVTFGTEDWDVGGYWASSRLTPLVAGKYAFKAAAFFSAGIVTQFQYQVAVYKNGSAWKWGDCLVANGTLGVAPTVSSTVYLNGSTDYAEIFCFGGGTGNKTISGDPALTWVQVERVG